MTETDRMRINDLKINKNNLAANKATKSTRGISLDNDHKAIDGLTKLITQTNKNDEKSNQALKMILRNEENSNVKSLSPEKGFHIDYILPPIPPNKLIKKTLVLDLDETLIHSNFESFSIPTDILLKIELDKSIKDIHVLKRTGVDDFLKRMAQFYEIIIFTASLSKYADPLIDILDKHRVCSIRLFREHCTLFNGLYVKELKRLNRNMKHVILLDNNPASYYLDIENGLPIKSFYDDKSDTELQKIGDVLENLSQVHDVREYLKEIISLNQVDYERANLIFEEFKQNKIKNSKHRHQTTNTSNNENNISVIKSVNIDENTQSEYQMNTNDYNDNNNLKNSKQTNANIKPNRNGNAKNDNFNNNRNIAYSIKNENIKGAGSGHIRNKSSLESEKKMLITFNNAKNSSSHRDHQNNINNNSNQVSFNNTNVSISNNTIGNQIQSNGNKANNDTNNRNTGQAFPDQREENQKNSNNNNINNDDTKNQALRENLNAADISSNNPTNKVNNNNDSNINNVKERMYEKIAEKFTKQQNQLKILHVEKIAMQRSSQKGGVSSNINNSKNLKKMKSTRNPTISPNIMVNSNSRAKLNSKRLGADSSKENSLVRNSFLNNSNTTKNSQKTEFFKLKNLNNLIRSKDSSSKQNSFQINSERAYNINNTNKTNSVSDKDNRDNSIKSYKYGFAIKNKTSSGNFFKLDKKNSEKSLKLNLNLDLNTQGDLNVKTTDMNVNNIENQNESVNVNGNSTSIINSSSGNVMKRPASVTNSNNSVFKYPGNYFSIRQQNSVKSSNGNSNNIRINNNNNNQNSISNNIGSSYYNSNSTRSLIENRIKNKIKNAAISAGEGDSLNKGESVTPIGNMNNNNNKVNSIRVNKEINNNKNNDFMNYKKDENRQETVNSINKDNADDEYFYLTNKENLEKIISENQTTLTSKSNMNNRNHEEEAVLSAQNKPVPMEEKSANFKIGINESIDINNLNNLNNNLSNNLNSLITQNLYLNTNNNYNNNHSNKTIKGSLTTKNSSNSLVMNNYFTSKNQQKGPISQNTAYVSTKNDTSNRINNSNKNNISNNSSTKIRSKKADSTPRHSFNAVDLKKAVMQDPAFNNKMNFFSKNFITNAPITVRNVSASQKINKKDLIFNSNNNNKNSNHTNHQTNINTKSEIKINTNNDNFNNNYNNIEVKEPYNNTNLKPNAETTKNLGKNNSKNTMDKMDEFMKVSNPTTTARNVKNARMFMFDINNKSNHNNSANNSKDKYFAILNKKNPRESSNTFSTSSYSTSSSANRKPFNTISNNLKSQNSLDMKIIRIQSVAKGRIQPQMQDNNIWSNGVNNRMTSAKN